MLQYLEFIIIASRLLDIDDYDCYYVCYSALFPFVVFRQTRTNLMPKSTVRYIVTCHYYSIID